MEAIRGVKTIAEIAQKHKLHATQINLWKKQLLDGAEDVFVDGNAKTPSRPNEDSGRCADVASARNETEEQPGRLRTMVDYVADRIADESEIRRSKQFPYQYFAAYLNADLEVPQKIRTALHKAAEIACGNVPELPGPDRKVEM